MSLEDHFDGHFQLCYYCGEECDSLAGNPSRWPIPLCHRDEPGVVKWHHNGCVSERLIENGSYEIAAQLSRECVAMHNFIIKRGLYEEWHKERDYQLSLLSK